jgi:hypothetical protein
VLAFGNGVANPDVSTVLPVTDALPRFLLFVPLLFSPFVSVFHPFVSVSKSLMLVRPIGTRTPNGHQQMEHGHKRIQRKQTDRQQYFAVYLFRKPSSVVGATTSG